MNKHERLENDMDNEMNEVIPKTYFLGRDH